MKIFIIGMPGSGKSYLGKKLALSLKLKFYDLDHLIEKKENQTIKQLIIEKGDFYFRTLESTTLKNLEKENNIVISCGGGAPMYFDNLEFMKKHGVVLWLNTELKTISSRIQKNITRRPMFEGLKSEEIDTKIAELFALREKKYKKADFEINILGNNKQSLSSVIQIVMNFSKHKH
jgi:shikimate kinase